MEATSSAAGRIQCPLPPEVLQLVLRHVDPRQRLGPCSLVCREWHAAAIAATSSVSVGNADQRRATALSDWLQRHGGQVEQLQVEGVVRLNDTPDLVLPFQQLTKLDKLRVMHVNVCPFSSGCSKSAEGCSSSSSRDSGSHGPQQQHLAALTRLTQLHLWHVRWAGGLQNLSALTSLLQLNLYDIDCLGDDTSLTEGADGAVDAAIGGVVFHLVQLTSLYLGNRDDVDKKISDASLAHISRLQQLKKLETSSLPATSASLAALPQSLTRLDLELDPVVLSRSTTPALAQLTALQYLELWSECNLEPVLLSQVTQLTYLRLTHGGLEPAGSAGAAAALLSAIASMTLLQHLELRCLDEPHAPAVAYAALTASSHLTCLEVGDMEVDVIPVPAGALNHMFAAGRQLLSLRHLTAIFKQEQQQQVVPDQWALWQQGFNQLLQCCLGLQSLRLKISDGDDGGRQQPPIKLDGLLALTGLTWLSLDGLLVDEGGITNTLAQLTNLGDLNFKPDGVTYTALLQLTKLQELDRLRIGSTLFCSWISDVPVWQQLQEHCVYSCKECAQMVLLQLQEVQAQLTKQLAEARQQLATQQAQHEAQQAQYEAQLAEARQHLAAQQAQHKVQQAQYEAQLAEARQQLATQQAQHEAQLARFSQQLQ